jgi:transmembrane sensor
MEASDDQNLYARWLSNELTPEEHERLEASGEAEILRQIIRRTDSYRLPELDEQTYARIRARIERQQAKIVPFYRKRTFIAVAASLALLIGLFWFYRTTGDTPLTDPVELAGKTGDVKTYVLADKTNITLYGKSTVTYDKASFGKDRVLQLEGEAYFDVRKKGAFTVELPLGTVAVTGTEFNVLADDNLLSVRCYEGSVEVTANGKTTVLTPGKGVRIEGKAQHDPYAFNLSQIGPQKTSRQVENISLREVCTSLSLQYGVTFDTGNTDQDRSFTGTIALTNLETALTLVCEPMQLKWRKEGKRIFLENR